jgi:AraC-like DNA-binding protein
MKDIPVKYIGKAKKETGPTAGFSIRDLSTLLSGKEMRQELHRHDFFFILALEKGRGSHIIDFTTYSVRDYSVFVLRPGQVHELTLGKESTGYLLEFSAGFFAPREGTARHLLRKLGSRNLYGLDAAGSRKPLSLLAAIFEEYAQKKERYTEVIRAILEVFFIELLRNDGETMPIGQGKNPYAQERLEELMVLLETHIATKKQVGQYARMLHLSAFQLNSITKETVGKTCSELITEQVLLESKRYLLATHYQVNQVASHLGYEDVSYFIRFFKKHTGYSPEAFRQNFK